MSNEGNQEMRIDEAKKLLEDNGYILTQLSDLGVSVNNGIQDIEPTEAYEINTNDPVCPCCGQKLRLKNADAETEEFIGESVMNESWEKQYILCAIQDVADQLYDEELADIQPEVDEYGNISPEYFKRFEYTSPELRRATKRAATKLANDLKEQGININPWYCEMEIYDKLKCFSK
jgi:hypothetical protein